MVEKDNKFIMLLDVDNVFSAEEVISLKETAELNTEVVEEKK
jgi:hypothetical protein